MNVRIFWVRAMKCMCAQTRPRFILSSERVFGGMEFEPMLTPREKSPLPENVPRGGSNPRHRGQRAHALPTELFRPRTILNSPDLGWDHKVRERNPPPPPKKKRKQAKKEKRENKPVCLFSRTFLNWKHEIWQGVGVIQREYCNTTIEWNFV